MADGGFDEFEFAVGGGGVVGGLDALADAEELGEGGSEDGVVVGGDPVELAGDRGDVSGSLAKTQGFEGDSSLGAGGSFLLVGGGDEVVDCVSGGDRIFAVGFDDEVVHEGK